MHEMEREDPGVSSEFRREAGPVTDEECASALTFGRPCEARVE